MSCTVDAFSVRWTIRRSIELGARRQTSDWNRCQFAVAAVYVFIFLSFFFLCLHKSLSCQFKSIGAFLSVGICLQKIIILIFVLVKLRQTKNKRADISFSVAINFFSSKRKIVFFFECEKTVWETGLRFFSFNALLKKVYTNEYICD